MADTSADTSREHATVRFEAKGCVMGHWRDITIVVWATQATVPLALEFKRMAEHVLSEHPQSSTIQVLAPGSTVPTPEARAVINELIAQHAAKLIGCAAVLEGSGFWASTMRSFLTGLQLFQRNSFKTNFCSNLDEAARWLAELHAAQAGLALERADVLAVARQLRARPSVQR